MGKKGRTKYEPCVLLGDDWHWEVSKTGAGGLCDGKGRRAIEVMPERMEVRHRGAGLPGKTNWRADHEEVRVALEAYVALMECIAVADLEPDVLEDMIHSVTKDLARYESMVSPEFEHAFSIVSDDDRRKRDIERAWTAKRAGRGFKPRETLYVCETPACLVALGCDNLPIFLNANHALAIADAPTSAGDHRHGIPRAVFENLETLLSSPAMVIDALNGATRHDAVVCVLAAVDADANPIIAVIRPHDETSYEGSGERTNRLMSLYGKQNIAHYIKRAADEGKIVYIDQKKTEELEMRSSLQLRRGIQGLPADKIIRPSEVIGKTCGAGGKRSPKPAACGIGGRGEPAWPHGKGAKRDHGARRAGSFRLDLGKSVPGARKCTPKTAPEADGRRAKAVSGKREVRRTSSQNRSKQR